MSNIDPDSTSMPFLPVRTGPAQPRPSLARSTAGAAFVSQLIAERDRLPPQRARRVGTPEGAIGAYSRGARLGERRMPAGYRTSVVA
jgi:hypothetical protein